MRCAKTSFLESRDLSDIGSRAGGLDVFRREDHCHVVCVVDIFAIRKLAGETPIRK